MSAELPGRAEWPHASGQRHGGGAAQRVRRAAPDDRRRPVPRPQLREGRARRCRSRAGRVGAEPGGPAADSRRRQGHRREDHRDQRDRDVRGARAAARRHPGRGAPADQDPGPRAEARADAVPGTARRLAGRAARRDQGWAAHGPAGLRQQERGEAAARHRAAGKHLRPGPAERGRRDCPPRRPGDQRGAGVPAVRCGGLAAQVRRDRRRRRRAGRRGRLRAAHGRAHRAARGRGGRRRGPGQDLGPHRRRAAGRPAGGPAGLLGRGPAVLHRIAGAQRGGTRDRGAQEAQALRIRPVRRRERREDRVPDRGGGLPPPRDVVDTADAARALRRGRRGAARRPARAGDRAGHPRRPAHAHRPDRRRRDAGGHGGQGPGARVCLLRDHRPRPGPGHAADDGREDAGPARAGAPGSARAWPPPAARSRWSCCTEPS